MSPSRFDGLSKAKFQNLLSAMIQLQANVHIWNIMIINLEVM